LFSAKSKDVVTLRFREAQLKFGLLTSVPDPGFDFIIDVRIIP
jgi:hypothetical protein